MRKNKGDVTYFIEKEGNDVYIDEMRNEKFINKFIETVDKILSYRGHGTDISLMLNNDILLEYRNQIFDFIKIIEKDGNFSGI